jgi:hypothetical protein
MPHSAAGPRDRTAGIRAERARDKPGGNCRPGAARRAAGEVIAVPWVARRRPGQVERRAAMREFVGGELSGQHGSRLVQLAHSRGVGGGDGVDTDSRMAGRADPGGRIDVLQPERDAVHRAATTARRDLAFGLASLIDRSFGRWQQVRVKPRVERLRPPDQCGRQLDRRELLALDQARRLGDRQKCEFIGHSRHSAFV